MTKTFTQGLLASAVLSTIALAQGDAAATAGGWSAKPGSGVKYDGGDAYSLTIVNQLQTHWVYTDNEFGADTNSFNVRRARTSFYGHAFNKNLKYVLRLDATDSGAAGDGAIKDGHVTWNFVNGEDSTIGLRMGQGKVLHGLESTASSSGLFFVERSPASRGFSDGRSRGAWLVGAAMKNQLRWSVGAMNTEAASGLSGLMDLGEESANTDNEPSFTGMINFDPMGDITDGKSTESWRQGDFRTDDKALKGTLGFGLAIGNSVDSAGPGIGQDVESLGLNFNTAWSIEGFQVMGEYFMRTDDLQGPTTDEEEANGWYLSGTYVMPKSGDSTIQWGFGVRVGMVENDEGATGSGVDYLTGLQGIGVVLGDATEISLVADAFYHTHTAKTQIEYTWQDLDAGAAGDATNHILRVAFQLLF